MCNRVLISLVLFGLVAPAGHAGMNVPERAMAVRPHWLVDSNHVEFELSISADGLTRPAKAYVARDDGSELRPATGADVVARPDPTLSPDGQERAFFGNDGNLWVSAVDGTGARRLTAGGDAYLYAWQPIAWSPDGTRIAFTWGASRGSALAYEVDVIAAAGGKRRRVHVGTSVGWINIRTIAVGLEGYATDIVRVDLDTGRAVRLVDGYYSPGGFDLSPDATQIAFTSYVERVYDRGASVYAARTNGVDRDVRRLSPDPCTVRQTLYSSSGRCVDGSNAADRLLGTTDSDLIVAGAGDDDIRAGDGGDTIYGQWGIDAIRGGNGNDGIYAGAGNDTIRSGAGADLVAPGPGGDLIVAGRGNDRILTNDGQRDIVDCGPGNDGVRAERIDVLRHCEHISYARPQPDQGL